MCSKQSEQVIVSALKYSKILHSVIFNDKVVIVTLSFRSYFLKRSKLYIDNDNDNDIDNDVIKLKNRCLRVSLSQPRIFQNRDGVNRHAKSRKHLRFHAPLR